MCSNLRYVISSNYARYEIMNVELFMVLANITFLCGTSFLFLKVIKNRDSIKDFDKVGSGLTFVGMIFSTIALVILNMWTAILFSIPTILFWGFVFILFATYICSL